MSIPFDNRVDAGRQLAGALASGRAGDVLVLALPRGGVPVAYEVATALDAPLDLLIVRKLGVPGHEELAMGAIATGGARVLNKELIRQIGIDEASIAAVVEREERELKRREQAYRGDRSPPDLLGRDIVVIDDGLATGSTMLAAVSALRQRGPARITVAVPVAPPDTCRALERVVDEVVCLATPEPFGGVGRWYVDFNQTSDDQVRRLLGRAWAGVPAPTRESS